MTLKIADLGDRIAIIGGSNAGKSTLAHKLGNALGLPVHHLDIYRFKHGTFWEKRPKDNFLDDVRVITSTDRWIVEGSYDSALAILVNHATTVIHLTPSRWLCLYRYLRLTMRQKLGRETRLGMPDMPSSMRWIMIHWIIWKYPQDNQSIKRILKGYQGNLIETDRFD